MRAFDNNVSGRSISDLSGLSYHWLEPADVCLVDFLDETGTLTELAEFKGTEISTFISNQGHSAAAMYDLSILERKVQTCYAEMLDNLYNDRVEFGNVIAYTYALLSAKLVIAYLGIFFIKSRNVNYVIDFASQFGGHSFLKEYKKAAKEIEKPIKIVRLGGQDIDHKTVWEILTALGRKKSITGKSVLDDWLEKFEYSREKIVRNKLLYTSAFWPDDSPERLPNADGEVILARMSELSRDCVILSYSDYMLAGTCSELLAEMRKLG